MNWSRNNGDLFDTKGWTVRDVEGDIWLKMIKTYGSKKYKKNYIFLFFFRFRYKERMEKYDKNELEKNKIIDTKN
jgi:hypothetical protein